MKKKYFIFILLFILLMNNDSFANIVFDIDLISNLDNKTSIKILRPCVTEYYKNDEPIKNIYDKEEEQITDINNILNTINDEYENNNEYNGNENNFTKNKMTYKFYQGMVNNNGKTINVLPSIYSKIISNLNITKLYNIDEENDSCLLISKYMKEQDMIDISEYIFSGAFSNSSYVISSDISVISENEIKLQVFIWDMLDERFLDGKYYIINIANTDTNKIADKISDFIFQKTTGEKSGLFDSKIIYVSETGSITNRNKQIAIMNFDGSKNTTITSGKKLKLTPIFSRYDQNEIFYLEYTDDGPFIIKHNLLTKSFSKIITKNNQCMTSAANFNPNNKNQIIISGTEENKGTNLYLIDFDKGTNIKLTNNKYINTSASFSPDGKKIVYVSDKNGSRRIYVKNLETGEENIISKGDGIYDKPVWSPDGRLIAFIKILKGYFFLGVMTTDGEGERLLTSSYLLEGVKWSPNSRYLIYTKQFGAFGKSSIPKLFIMDILTKNEYKLNTPDNEGASDPDWIINK